MVGRGRRRRRRRRRTDMVEMVEAKEQVEVAYAREEKCMSFDISCRTVKLAVRVELGKNYNTQNYLDDSQLGYF
jgi:hypothetical protein